MYFLELFWQYAPMERPVIYHYFDYRKYLKDFISFKKATQSGFSLAVLVRQEDSIKRSLLSLIINNKRNLTKEKIPHLTSLLKLEAKEHDYFNYLVQYNQAKNDERKRSLLEELVSYQEKMNGVEKLSLSFLADWKTQLIYHLAKQDDFILDCQWIEGKINGLLSKEQIKRIVDIFIQHRVFEVGIKGEVTVNQFDFLIEDDVNNIFEAKKQMGSMELALNVLSEKNQIDSSFESLYLPLDEQAKELIHSRLKELQKELAARDLSKQDQTLGMMNFQLLTLTRPVNHQ